MNRVVRDILPSLADISELPDEILSVILDMALSGKLTEPDNMDCLFRQRRCSVQFHRVIDQHLLAPMTSLPPFMFRLLKNEAVCLFPNLLKLTLFMPDDKEKDGAVLVGCLTRLVKLSFTFDQTRIPQLTFRDNMSIDVLSNSLPCLKDVVFIDHVSPTFFQKCPRVETARLAEVSMNDTVIASMWHLRSLSLDNCLFAEKINTDVFTGMQNLETLVIREQFTDRRHRIPEIPLDIVRGMTKLEWLALGYTDAFCNMGLAYLTRLETLYLSSSSIYLTDGVLASLQNLRSLNLHGRCDTLSDRGVNTLTKLRDLVVIGHSGITLASTNGSVNTLESLRLRPRENGFRYPFAYYDELIDMFAFKFPLLSSINISPLKVHESQQDWPFGEISQRVRERRLLL